MQFHSSKFYYGDHQFKFDGDDDEGDAKKKKKRDKERKICSRRRRRRIRRRRRRRGRKNPLNIDFGLQEGYEGTTHSRCVQHVRARKEEHSLFLYRKSELKSGFFFVAFIL